MAFASRRSIRAFVIGGALLASQALVVSGPTSPALGNSCASIRQWARAYDGSSPTLEELARYDRAHRVAIFNTVTAQVRSALWQEQLRRLDQRSDLSLAQHAFIREGIPLMTTALYQKDAAASAAFKIFWSRASAEFASGEAKRGWFELGSVMPVGQPPITLIDRLTSPFRVTAQESFCECSRRWQDCGGPFCVAAGCAWFQGCGPGWGFFCDGFCQ
jgi:hypothetical protein